MIEVRHLKKYFPERKGLFSGYTRYLKAVDNVSFNIPEGKTLGLVGESGCGKTTTGRTLLRLIPPTGGEFLFNRTSVFELSECAMFEMRRNMQIVFQDPYSSLDPRMTVGSIVEEAFIVHKIGSGKKKKRDAVKELFEMVGLPSSYINRYPHELSGGERQRVGIARAIALFAIPSLVGVGFKPAPTTPFIVCDEPVSALDVSIQAQIINLLEELQERFNISYLFIAHDLSVVRHISDEVAVMYLGRIAERAECNELFNNPLHPYTRALLSAIPVPDPETKRSKIMLAGEIPSPLSPPPGCSFHPRCPEAKAICKIREPELMEISPKHFVSCLIVSGIWS
ncbi:MAG: ABC transporter ATP-binding protein [Candidatus Brocadiales bacterium]